MQNDQHTAATNQVVQSPSTHHKPRPQHCAASDTALSDTPFPAAGHDAVLHQLGLMAPALTHPTPATLPSLQTINACQRQQQPNILVTISEEHSKQQTVQPVTQIKIENKKTDS